MRNVTAKVGDKVTYLKDGHIIKGIVADAMKSPLLGDLHYRIVDFASEMEDEDAGRWINADKLIDGET